MIASDLENCNKLSDLIEKHCQFDKSAKTWYSKEKNGKDEFLFFYEGEQVVGFCTDEDEVHSSYGGDLKQGKIGVVFEEACTNADDDNLKDLRIFQACYN